MKTIKIELMGIPKQQEQQYKMKTIILKINHLLKKKIKVRKVYLLTIQKYCHKKLCKKCF